MFDLNILYYCRDAVIIALSNCITSFLSGFVIFSMLGFMAYQQRAPISSVVAQGKDRGKSIFMSFPTL